MTNSDGEEEEANPIGPIVSVSPGGLPQKIVFEGGRWNRMVQYLRLHDVGPEDEVVFAFREGDVAGIVHVDVSVTRGRVERLKDDLVMMCRRLFG